jgi:hypothetical protein
LLNPRLDESAFLLHGILSFELLEPRDLLFLYSGETVGGEDEADRGIDLV